MLRATITIASAVMLFLSGAGTLPAQEDEADPERQVSDLIEVSEVALDVLATDRKGAPILGLGVADFVVEEDGKPVEITGVSYYANRYGDAGASDPAEIPASRYLIFYFHDQSAFLSDGAALLRQQIRAARDAMRWVETEMAPSDWAAIVRYDVRLQIYQDFTQDREALVAALERAAAGQDPEEYVPGRREARARGQELKILSRISDDASLARETRNPYEGLGKLAEATGYLVGRKVLLLYSVGFGERRGRTSLPDERYYPALETVLNDHNVAVYPVDLTPPGRPPIQQDFFQQLADDSGGAYDPNFSGFLQPLRTITQANTGYYLLTYRSARPAGEIGYQRVTIKAKNPDIRLLTRKGYRFGL